MLHMTVAWYELIVRAVVVYLFLVVILRLTGKRQVGELAPFDLVLLLILSNAVQNAIHGGDNSLVAGLIAGTTLVLLNFGMGVATDRSVRLEKLVEGQPILLIHNGKVNTAGLARSHLTHRELNAALRAHGVVNVADVHVAMLEDNGEVSVAERKRKQGQA